jgi:hypothetical protein
MSTMDEKGGSNIMFSIIFTILSEFAKAEAEYIKARSISGMTDKVRRGHIGPGGFHLYGFKSNQDKQMVICEEEATVVKDVFKYVKSGLGSKQIAHILNEAGIPTRTQKNMKKRELKMKNSSVYKPVKEVEWVDGTVYSMLKNSAYAGERNWKGEIVKCPAIITKKEWQEVQEIMAERHDDRSSTKRYQYLLRGLVKCSKCGRNYYARYKAGGSDAYYQCSSTRIKGHVCGNRGVSIEALESTVFDVIKDSPKLFEYLQMTGVELKQNEQNIQKSKVQMEIHKKDLKSKEAEKERVLQLYLKGKISETRMDDDTAKIQKGIDALKTQVKKLTSTLQSLAETKMRLNNMDTYSSLIFKVGEDRIQLAQVLRHVIDRVQIRSVNDFANNTDFILSIFIKGIAEPLTGVLHVSRTRNGKGSLVDPGIAKAMGQGWFVYYDGGQMAIKYDRNGKLSSSIDKIITSVMKRNEDEDGDIWHRVPKLITFDEGNAVEKVKPNKKKIAA